MTPKTPKAPKGLSREARRLWDRLHADYVIDDEAGQFTLRTALEAFDRMREAQKIIAKDGPCVTDRFGQKRAHPLLTVERDARAQMMAALRALNFDVLPAGKVGRPAGAT
jgi:P27 family predicted phage terminase small subunit